MASFYEIFAYIGGLLYLNLYVWIMFPSIFIFLQNFFGGKSKVEDNSHNGGSHRIHIYIWSL